LIASFLSSLKEIGFTAGANPRVGNPNAGDTANLRAIRLSGTFQSGPFRYRTYEADSLSARLRFERDSIIVRELELRDGPGKLQAEFELNLPKQDLLFQFTSSIRCRRSAQDGFSLTGTRTSWSSTNLP